MASYQEQQDIGLAILALKGIVAEGKPEEQQAVAECRQAITELLEKYNDMGKVALTLAFFEMQLKEG